MKRVLLLVALIAVCCGWSVTASAQAPKPKLKRMTFRLENNPDSVVTCTGNNKLFATLIFDIAMRDSIPKINLGIEDPNSFNLPITGPEWFNDTTFVAYFVVAPGVPPLDGVYKFMVSGAYSAAGVKMDSTSSDMIKNDKGLPPILSIYRTGILTADVAKIDFPTIPVGAYRDRKLVLKNTSCANVQIGQVSVGEQFLFLPGQDDLILKPEETREVIVRFQPKKRDIFASTLTITYAGKNKLDIVLTGTARGPQLALTPVSTLFFEDTEVGNQLAKTVKVKNVKAEQEGLSDSLKINDLSAQNSEIFQAKPNTLKLAPGDSQNVTMTFRPAPDQGPFVVTYNGSAVFRNNDSTQSQRVLALSGRGYKKEPPPTFPTFTYNWPYGRVGYINSSYFTICLQIADTTAAKIRQVRWKFSLEPNKPPTAPNDTSSALFGGGSALYSVNGCGYRFSIPLASRLTGYPYARLYYYIWFEGVNGVSGYTNPYTSELNYDVAAPTFTTAPNAGFGRYGWTGGYAYYTNGDSLTLCWQSSDPSGISEVRWKLSTTNDPPRNRRDTARGDTLRRDGVNCVTIPLKGKIGQGRWYLYVWLIDGSGNSSHQSASRLFFLYDLTAPTAPAGPFARSIPRGDWFNGRRNPLTLSFNIIDGVRDAARVFWKFKVKPAGTTVTPDGQSAFMSNEGQWSFPVNFNSTALCGEDSLYFWLADSAGNVNFLNHAVTGYKFDMCSPVITRWRSGEPLATKRTAFSDTVKIFDHTKVTWDSVLYRFGGARANEPPRRLQRVANSRDLFVVTIPADGVTMRGLDYQVFAKDSLKNPYGIGPMQANYSNLCEGDGEGDGGGDEGYYWQAVRVQSTGDGEYRIDKDGNPVAQPSGRDQNSYALFSVPLELTKNTPKDILEDDLGAYDRTKWKFFEYRPDMAPNGWVEYNSTAPTIAPFIPGRAFFALVADPDRVIDSGAGKTVSTGKQYVIELKKGWNLFGNPYNFPISRDYLMLVNSSFPLDSTKFSLRSYEGGWNIDNTIEPWKGYAIYVEPKRLNEKIQLVICPIATIPRIGKNSAVELTSAKDWTIQIAATAGAARDTINWVGARSTAAMEYDNFDLVEPPVIGEYVSVYVPNEKWALHPMKYTADFRPVEQEVYEWPLQVNTNAASGEVVLEFKNLANLPAEYEAYLIDAAYGVARNLKHNPTYRFVASAAGSDKSLKLLVGKPEVLSKHTGGIALVPSAFELAQNFPNPFATRQAQAFTAIRYALPKSATVSVEVYNMLGQKVRTLVNRQFQAADYYLATWNGRDEVGKEVSSGVYVYRILAESQGERFTATKKLLLVK